MLVLLLLPALLAALSSFSVSARSQHGRHRFGHNTHRQRSLEELEQTFEQERVIEQQLDAYAAVNHTLDKRAGSSYGLSTSNLASGRVSIGFIPGYGEAKGANTLSQINALLPKPAAVGLHYLWPGDGKARSMRSAFRSWEPIVPCQTPIPTSNVSIITFQNSSHKNLNMEVPILSSMWLLVSRLREPSRDCFYWADGAPFSAHNWLGECNTRCGASLLLGLMQNHD